MSSPSSSVIYRFENPEAFSDPDFLATHPFLGKLPDQQVKLFRTEEESKEQTRQIAETRPRKTPAGIAGAKAKKTLVKKDKIK